MRELLDAAIDEIERVVIGNKDRNTEEVYLKNAIRHIREYGSQPQLNENQQIVLENLKINATDNYTKSVNRLFSSIAVFADAEPAVDNRISKAYVSLNTYQEAQVLELFSKWAQEQEEE